MSILHFSCFLLVNSSNSLSGRPLSSTFSCVQISFRLDDFSFCFSLKIKNLEKENYFIGPSLGPSLLTEMSRHQLLIDDVIKLLITFNFISRQKERFLSNIKWEKKFKFWAKENQLIWDKISAARKWSKWRNFKKYNFGNEFFSSWGRGVLLRKSGADDNQEHFRSLYVHYFQVCWRF